MRLLSTLVALTLLALVGFGCAPATSTPTSTPGAVATATGKPSTAVATATTAPSATTAPAATIALPSGSARADGVNGVGKTTAIDLAAGQFSMLLSTSNKTFDNQVVTFRVDDTSKLMITGTGRRTATTLADYGLKVGEQAGIGFYSGTYDPATKTYVIGVIQRNGP